MTLDDLRALDWPSARLAAALVMARGTVANWLSGREPPSPGARARLAAVEVIREDAADPDLVWVGVRAPRTRRGPAPGTPSPLKGRRLPRAVTAGPPA